VGRVEKQRGYYWRQSICLPELPPSGCSPSTMVCSLDLHATHRRVPILKQAKAEYVDLE